MGGQGRKRKKATPVKDFNFSLLKCPAAHSLGFDVRLVLVVRLQVAQHVAHALDRLLCRVERGQGDVYPLIMH